ncbi:MAG: NnrS family protein [Pseudomonadales bacterium]
MNNPILALGFRPFYLLAAVFAVITLPLWVAIYLGVVQPGGYLQGVAWHSHEMIFGFATAVIAGFLLTAVRNWTSQPTPTGTVLAGLAALWLLGRLLGLTGPVPVAVLVDVAFLPVLGVALAVPIWRSRNTRNLKILVVLAVLTLANLSYHLAYLNVLPGKFMQVATTAALDVITILMAIIGGRVIPVFTANAITTASPRSVFGVEVTAFAALVVVLVAGLLTFWYPLPATLWLALLVTAALVHGMRLLLWQPYRSYRNPLLWMLPVAYAWIPISLLLRALAQIAVVPSAVAIHALTLGAISSLMLAMMTRSALGHTGRQLSAGPVEISAFVLLQLAAVVRVFAGFIWPEFYRETVVISGMLWCLAFVLFLLRYWPMLTRPRIDGVPG